MSVRLYGCTYVLHNRQGHSSVSQFEVFLLKIDNEPIFLYYSGKRFQIFKPG